MLTVIILVHRMASICSLTVSTVTPFSCTKIQFFRIASSPMVRIRSINAPPSYAHSTRNNFSETTLVAFRTRMVTTTKWETEDVLNNELLKLANGTHCLLSAEFDWIVRELFSIGLRGRQCSPQLFCWSVPNESVFWYNLNSCCSPGWAM